MAATAAGTARSRTSSSSLTSIRRAWKVRFAGCRRTSRRRPEPRRGSGSTSSPVVVNGFAARRRDDPVGDPARELLLAPLPDDPDQVLFAVVVDDVGGGLAAAGVHPHVQGRVEGVGEAAFPLVELQGGDAEVHQDAVDFRETQVLKDLRDFVIHGVDQVDAVREGRQALPCQGQRFLVAVDPDQVQVRKALRAWLRRGRPCRAWRR